MPVAKIIISNKRGLHARAAARFAALANEYCCQVQVRSTGDWVNGKSVMSLMLLAASMGTSIEIRTEGEDADTALRAICSLIEDKFEEGE